MSFIGTANFLLEVAKGNIAGHKLMVKFGENPDIDSGGTFEDVWDFGGNYADPTATSLHDVTSSLATDTGLPLISSGTATGGSFTTLVDSAADFVSDSVAVGDRVLNDSNVMIGTVSAINDLNTLTMIGQMRNPNSGLPQPPTNIANPDLFALANASGDTYRVVRDQSTGAPIVHIAGLGAAVTEQDEFVVLNGTGTVATTKTYSHQHRARIFTSATTAALGNINSVAQSGSTTSVRVSSSANQSLMTPYTVPLDKTGYILKWWASMSKATANPICDVHLMGGSFNGVRYELETRSINVTATSQLTQPYVGSVAIPGGASLWLKANSTVNDTGVSGGFTVLLVDL